MQFTKSLWALFEAGYTKQEIMEQLFPTKTDK